MRVPVHEEISLASWHRVALQRHRRDRGCVASTERSLVIMIDGRLRTTVSRHHFCISLSEMGLTRPRRNALPLRSWISC
jgi:hypothetical protein